MESDSFSFVPQEFRKGINKAFEVGRTMIREARTVIEPEAEIATVARTVEEYRWAWRPSIVRTVLIAESHVYTNVVEAGLSIGDVPSLKAQRVRPRTYVRFVYCLGYGESSLVINPNLLASPNGGTPHYWSLFARLAGMTPMSTRFAEVRATERIRTKIEILERLKDRGIWLLDASVHAIYCPGGFRRSTGICEKLHKSWLAYYGQPLLNSLEARHVCVVGKALFGTLQRLGLRAHGWIYQPHVKIHPELHQRQLNGLLSRL